ncbi:branched-chain amino acid ABC transporter permease [Micromonospora wenchangensis]|uniref:branched-chain amino acid ABC transporter permease n=1 Tax=Micromonospora wenchangensis TaxID=1185415 RepID=UPI0038191880
MTSLAPARPATRPRLRPAVRNATGLAAGTLLLAAAPLYLAPYATTTLTRILVFGLLAASLNLLVGVVGLPSLGHAAFFGVGAYAAAFSALHGTSGVPALLVGMAAAALVALVAGAVAVRTGGVFFLMLTLAVGELTQQAADSWESVTGGSNGLYGVPAPTLSGLVLDQPATTYWYVLAFFLVGLLALRLATTSATGVVLRGVRDSEDRMRALGYRTTLVKLGAFVFAGAVAGLAGGLLAAQQRLVTPADAGFETSALALLAVVIGGTGSWWGPCLGAALVIVVRDSLGATLDGHGPLALGLLFVLVVYLLPTGIARIRPRRTAP